MRSLFVLSVAWVFALVLPAASEVFPPALLDPASDRVLARTPVPDAARKVGEVRLVARGDAIVVQTLLRTKVLSRVVAEIRRKEEANWPPTADGYHDMVRYRDAVAAAAATVPADDERRQRLLIEFVAAPSGGGIVLLAGFTGDEVDGAITPADRRTITTLPLGRAYVFPNMRFILADAFGVPLADVRRLGPLGPLADTP